MDARAWPEVGSPAPWTSSRRRHQHDERRPSLPLWQVQRGLGGRGLVHAWVTQNVTFLRYAAGMTVDDSPPPCTLVVSPWLARGGCGCITGNGVSLGTAATIAHGAIVTVIRCSRRCSVGVPRRRRAEPAEPEPASGRASKLWLPTARVVDIGYCGYGESLGSAGEGHTGFRRDLAKPWSQYRDGECESVTRGGRKGLGIHIFHRI